MTPSETMSGSDATPPIGDGPRERTAHGGGRRFWQRRPGPSGAATSTERPARRRGLSVAMRVALLAIGGVLSMVVVLGIYSRIDRQLVEATAAAEYEASMRERLADVYDGVKGLDQLRLTSGPKLGEMLVPAVEGMLGKASSTVEALSAAEAEGTPTRDMLERLHGQMAALKETLVDLLRAESAAGVRDDSGARAVLGEEARAIETQLAELAGSARDDLAGGIVRLERTIYRLGRIEKAFMLAAADGKPTDAIVSDFLQTHTGFYADLMTAGLPSRVEDALIARIDAYGRAFEVYTRLDADRGARRDLAARAFQEVMARFNDLNDASERSVNALNARVAETIATGQRLTYGAATVAVVLLVLLGAWAIGSTVPPLRRITHAMGRISGGALDEPVPGERRGDEIGEMARALLVFRDTARETARLREAESGRQAEAERVRRAATQALASHLEASVAGVVAAVSDTASKMSATSARLDQAVEESGRQAGGAASAASETDAHVGEVARAAEELSQSVAEIGGQARRSADIVRDAVAQTKVADEGVAELSSAAASISDVVQLIATIAEQTNLLALNATIEASRAGEAGRGFTVVANEVKSLAGQTAKATQEIAARIGAMQKTTDASTKSVRAIGQTVHQIDEIVALIAAAVEQQEATTAGISRSMGEASSGTASVSSRIDALDANAREARGAAEDVSGASAALAGQAEALRAEVARVIESLRAA